MLVKKITKKGDAIGFTAKEAIPDAVARAVKSINTLECVYWVDRRSIEITGFRASAVDTNGNWDANVEGTVKVGKTVAATGNFHDPKPHYFRLHYRAAKDDLGLPDIQVLPDSEVYPLETNPAKLVGDTPEVPPPAEPVIGELVAQEALAAAEDKKDSKKAASKGKI